MRILLQRVKKASVDVQGHRIAEIGAGYLLLVGMGSEDVVDGGAGLNAMAAKVLNLRVMADEDDIMNSSILDSGGAILAVSQFTLHADCRKGRRPSFTGAASPARARELFDALVERLRESGLDVQTGQFGAMMDVSLINDGPVTVWLDSEKVLH